MRDTKKRSVDYTLDELIEKQKIKENSYLLVISVEQCILENILDQSFFNWYTVNIKLENEHS